MLPHLVTYLLTYWVPLLSYLKTSKHSENYCGIPFCYLLVLVLVLILALVVLVVVVRLVPGIGGLSCLLAEAEAG